MSSTFRSCSKIRLCVVLHHKLHPRLQGPGGALHTMLCHPQLCLSDTLLLSIMLYLRTQERSTHGHPCAHKDAVLPAGSRRRMCQCARQR